jgi:FMN-dependent oxidoreductase (nitrilotriacetate monooxygenase family)
MGKPTHRLLLTVNINGAGLGHVSADDNARPTGFYDIGNYVEFAKLAHSGVLDSLWLPDLPMLLPERTGAPLHTLDPIQLMTALAMAVPDIGMVPTISTSYNSPYTIARQVATLDAISDGRAGVNAIASWHPRVAQNYGQTAVPVHPDRYGRADEFVQVLQELSDSWTLRPGPDGEKVFDPALARPIDHHGEHFEVKGPLCVPQSRQGRPLFSVAGGSEESKEFAARRADVFYVAQVDMQSAIDFAQDVRSRAAGYGRHPESIRIMPGLIPIIGSTQEEADRRADEYSRASGVPLDPVKRVAGLLEIDPKALHPDRQLTEEQMQLPATWLRPRGFFYSITELARRENLTVGELAKRFPMHGGHLVLVGTPDRVASSMLDWWGNGASDGFTILNSAHQQDVRALAEQVVPILQDAGAFPRHYSGDTLRERFGVVEREVVSA